MEYTAKKDDKERFRLTKNESRSRGSLGIKVIKGYIRDMGGYRVFVSITFFYVFAEGLRNFASQWMSWWSGGNEAWLPPSSNIVFFLGIYTALSLMQALTSLLNLLVLAFAGIHAAQTMHSKLIFTLLRSPMSFFNATPQGRILNRLSKDTGDIDRYLIAMTSIFIRGVVQMVGSLTVIGYTTTYALATFVPVLCILLRTALLPVIQR